jgi:hypothetical protein
MRPDGTGLRTVGSLEGFGPGAAWSPDGRWLLMHQLFAMVVEVTTGVAAPLTTSLGLSGLTWAR